MKNPHAFRCAVCAYTKSSNQQGKKVKMKKIFGSKKFLTGLIILALIAIGFGVYLLIPKHNVFVKGPSMNYSRFGSLATLLNDGNVLITGGENLKGKINIAEIYNSETNKFDISGKMNSTSGYNNAILLKTGNVLISGGQDIRKPVSYAEIYNPITKKFKLMSSLTHMRGGHTAVLLNNGNVLMTGGIDLRGSLSFAEIYDVKRNTFIKIHNMNYPRDNHTATLLNNGNVLIIGGNSKTSKGEIYDVKTNSFKLTEPMTYARYGGHTATLLNDGEVLITGGVGNREILSSIEIFNPRDNSFRYIGNLTFQRESHTATLLSDGGVLITGGTKPYSWAYEILKQAEIIYVKPSLIIKKVNNMKVARSRHNSTLLKDGSVLITSGNSNKYSTEIFEQ